MVSAGVRVMAQYLYPLLCSIYLLTKTTRHNHRKKLSLLLLFGYTINLHNSITVTQMTLKMLHMPLIWKYSGTILREKALMLTIYYLNILKSRRNRHYLKNLEILHLLLPLLRSANAHQIRRCSRLAFCLL